MIAISFFNGYGGLAIASLSTSINFDVLYSSEIDKHANEAAQLLYPKTIQLGDIMNWREWGVDWSSVDLGTAGSPCQGFSPAGLKGGTKAILNGKTYIVDTREIYLEMKEAGAEFVSQSFLFWEFVLLVDHIKSCNPDFKWMLENVKMTPNNIRMISNALGVEPVTINAELLLPQNRERLFWCNWDITQPKREQKVISDIMEETDNKLRPCVLREKIGFGVCHHIATASDVSGNDCIRRVYATSGKMPTLTTMQGGSREPKFIVSYNPPMYRAATIREMMRGQGMPEWVIDKLIQSDIAPTHLKKLLGNGWPIPVIIHILNCLIDSWWMK